VTSHLIIPDAHANPDFNNKRFEWLGQLIKDLKPDVVVNLGDGADMASLCSYDKGKKSFHGRTYKRDINSFTDSQHRLWEPLKKLKKRLPQSYYLIGNHEQRILRATELSPELEGTVSVDDLELGEWYDYVVPYDGNTPGTVEIDGVHYAHYFISGVMGRPISGEHPAHAILSKRLVSSTCGHLHLADYCIRTDGSGSKVMGLLAGVYQDYRSDYAGGANDLWWKGVVYKTNVQNGAYDLQFISLDQLRNEYGT
jgi:hypothetical protein